MVKKLPAGLPETGPEPLTLVNMAFNVAVTMSPELPAYEQVRVNVFELPELPKAESDAESASELLVTTPSELVHVPTAEPVIARVPLIVAGVVP